MRGCMHGGLFSEHDRLVSRSSIRQSSLDRQVHGSWLNKPLGTDGTQVTSVRATPVPESARAATAGPSPATPAATWSPARTVGGWPACPATPPGGRGALPPPPRRRRPHPRHPAVPVPLHHVGQVIWNVMAGQLWRLTT